MTNPLQWPAELKLSSIVITPRTVFASTQSVFTLQERTYEFPGERWDMTATLPIMERETAEIYMCFVLKLRQRVGSFIFPLPASISKARGSVSGSPKVDGAGQTGRTLNVKSLPVSQTVFKAGDYINLGSLGALRLYKITDDVVSDAEGKAALPIWPALRSATVDNADVAWETPSVLLRLVEEVGADIDVNRHYLMPFNAIERL